MMMHKKVIATFFCCAFLHGENFSIALDRTFEPKWQGHTLAAEEEKQLHAALSQSYLYLDSGTQSSAFLSEDGKYVIKLFKKQPYVLQTRLYIPLFSEWREARSLKKRAHKRDKIFFAYANCFDSFARETGILYVHFNTSDTLKCSLNLVDASGNAHSVYLDEVDFVVEKRAVSVQDYLQNLVYRNGVKKDKNVINALCSMIELHHMLYKKGMRNRDIELAKNFGFIDDKPVIFDVGRVVPCQREKDKRKYQRKLHRLLTKFREWMSEFNPALLPECDAAIAYAMENYYE